MIGFKWPPVKGKTKYLAAKNEREIWRSWSWEV